MYAVNPSMVILFLASELSPTRLHTVGVSREDIQHRSQNNMVAAVWWGQGMLLCLGKHHGFG